MGPNGTLGGNVNFKEDHSLRAPPKSFELSKPVVPGISCQDICNDFDEGITVLDPHTVVGEPRVGQELWHTQYVFDEFLELETILRKPHTWRMNRAMPTCPSFPAPIIIKPSLQGKTW